MYENLLQMLKVELHISMSISYCSIRDEELICVRRKPWGTSTKQVQLHFAPMHFGKNHTLHLKGCRIFLSNLFPSLLGTDYCPSKLLDTPSTLKNKRSKYFFLLEVTNYEKKHLYCTSLYISFLEKIYRSS